MMLNSTIIQPFSPPAPPTRRSRSTEPASSLTSCCVKLQSMNSFDENFFFSTCRLTLPITLFFPLFYSPPIFIHFLVFFKMNDQQLLMLHRQAMHDRTDTDAAMRSWCRKAHGKSARLAGLLVPPRLRQPLGLLLLRHFSEDLLHWWDQWNIHNLIHLQRLQEFRYGSPSRSDLLVNSIAWGPREYGLCLACASSDGSVTYITRNGTFLLLSSTQ